jgi:hypothetical protein
MAQLAIVIDLVEDPPRAIEALEVRAARVKRPGFDGSTSDGGPDSFPGSDYP